MRSWNCVFGTVPMVTGLLAQRPTQLGSVPAGQRILFFSERTRPASEPTASPLLVLMVISLGVKWPEREDDLLHPSDIVKVDRAILLPSDMIMACTGENLFFVPLVCTWAGVAQSV